MEWDERQTALLNVPLRKYQVEGELRRYMTPVDNPHQDREYFDKKEI